ncbi:anhydro-N-acetylmuramic acid kinase [Agaribacter flavus]|uniref:Anhydro-N-acetylmuramic acid kinase n=2 Tax=Agaribacter flavus TaxID=1902781 RepID=A0ABV7FN52_9ALTE
MSGTSLDGLDIALCRIKGSGISTDVEVCEFISIAYQAKMKKRIQRVFAQRRVDMMELTILNEEIGALHGKLVAEQLAEWGIQPSEVDCIASHGQTVFHAPRSFHQQMHRPNATFQIGDGDHVAKACGITTLSDFRQRHIAAGGEGAPLAMYGDYLLYASQECKRCLVNIGGIANLTYIPEGANFEDVVCSDLGPGNTLLDAYVRKYFTPLSYDKNAELATKGEPIPALLEALLAHPFFELSMPKTTGPELFSLQYLEDLMASIPVVIETTDCKAKTPNGLAKTAKVYQHVDVLTSLSILTAKSIAKGIKACIKTANKMEQSAVTKVEIYMSGGGVHNPLIMNNIRDLLPRYKVQTTETLGLDPDAKEAVLFALLANECLAGSNAMESHISQNTHDKPVVSMGKICFPD